MTLRDALATPDLRRLQAAWAAAAVGGWAFMVALAVYAYGEGGAAAVGLAALVRMVPAGLAAPLLGRAADRFPRRDVLLTSALVRAILLLALALYAALDLFAATLVLGALFTVAQAAHKPAQAALIPALTTRPEAANALWSTIDNAAFVLGALAGGLLVATAGAPVAFAAAASTFALAAILLANIKRDCPSLETGPGQNTPRTRHPGRSEPKAGLSPFRKQRELRVLIALLSVSTLVEGMVDVLVVVTALEVVDVGEAGVGLLNGAWGVGGVLGGMLALRMATRALPLGTVLVGAPLLALAALPGPVAALVALTTLGVGYSLVETSGLTRIQELTHDGIRARAFALLESTYWLTTGAGAMLAPLVIALTSPRGALVVAGAALPLAALLTRLVPLRVATAARPAAA